MHAAMCAHGQARLVGGAVRDLLLGRTPAEFDVVVTGDPHRFARSLGEIESEHERFGTLQTSAAGMRVDVVRARTESYLRPGALPTVVFADFAADLARRDFTVNAISADAGGGLHHVVGALEDLAAEHVAVLHGQSFLDDPTRLWRMVRYCVRLGFEPSATTARLARAAIAGGALQTVSAERHTTELRLLIAEPDPVAALAAAQALGLLEHLQLDRSVAESARELVAGRGDQGLAVLGAALPDLGPVAGFAWTAAERSLLLACAQAPAAPAVPPATPSEVDRMLRDLPAEAAAVAGARGSPATVARWFSEWSVVSSEVNGDDMLASGLTSGPKLGALLDELRAALLDGEVRPGRQSELEWIARRSTELRR